MDPMLSPSLSAAARFVFLGGQERFELSTNGLIGRYALVQDDAVDETFLAERPHHALGNSVRLWTTARAEHTTLDSDRVLGPHSYATCGQVGFEGRFEYTAIGTVTNLASRLCAEAKGGRCSSANESSSWSKIG